MWKTIHQRLNYKLKNRVVFQELMESKELIEDLIAEKEVNVEATMEEATDAE